MPRMRCGCSTWSAGATATLAASYLAAGFVHGVLNSDNINITGESFDYGPWRFTPDWDPDFTAAYFDHYGLYAFGRQPEAIHWDLAQLAGCLSLVAEAPPLSDMLAGWSDAVRAGADRGACCGASASRRATSDRELAGALIRALATRAQPIDRIFFDWRGGRDPGREALSGRAIPRACQAARRPGTAANARLLVRRRRPARCISRRSRRSGRRSPSATTGSRSRTRLQRSGGWAKQWNRMHRQA